MAEKSRFTYREKMFVFLAGACVGKDDQTNTIYRIKIKDLADRCGKTEEEMTQDIEAMSESLWLQLTWHEKNNHGKSVFRKWFKELAYDEKEIEFVLNDRVQDYFAKRTV